MNSSGMTAQDLIIFVNVVIQSCNSMIDHLPVYLLKKEYLALKYNFKISNVGIQKIVTIIPTCMFIFSKNI